MRPPISPDALRWRCDPEWLPFGTTADLVPGPRVPGQAAAAEALRFALSCDAPCQNVFVRGNVELGGLELVLDVVDEIRPQRQEPPDRCYVRNFADPQRPRLVTVARGRAQDFRRRVLAAADLVERGASVPGADPQGPLDAATRAALEDWARGLRQDFPHPSVRTFLAELLDDAERPGGRRDARRAWEVNVYATHDGPAPVVVERSPTAGNLLGAAGAAHPGAPDGHLSIQAGSILRADGGILVLRAEDVLAHRDVWPCLARALRDGVVEVACREDGGACSGPQVPLRPEPAPVSLRVALVGDHGAYRVLAEDDVHFEHLFKVLADLDPAVARDAAGARTYAFFVTRLAHDEGLLPFAREAVAALYEHGARIASFHGKVTARLLRIADIAREAAYVARRAGRTTTTRRDVAAAVASTKRRGSLDARRFQDFVATGNILLRVHGTAVGQVNGLAVIEAGALTYGFPARITASVGPGSGGIVDIEGRSSLSGSIHTKSFQILEGLLRTLLVFDHAAAFSASLAFEQSYGRIDGDSASVAEVACLLSALSGVPVRQGTAITGSLDQMGNVQPIGGVNEKIEGFFDTCRTLGLDGEQGVVIPVANVGDLMLREDVVAACAEGRFRVVAVETIHDALEALTGTPAGRLDENGHYPRGSLLHRALERSAEFRRLLDDKTARPRGLPPDPPAEAAPQRPRRERQTAEERRPAEDGAAGEGSA